MKIFLLISLLATIHLHATDNLDQLMKQEVQACFSSDNKAADIYNQLQDKYFTSKSELKKFKDYQRALLDMEKKCKKIYIFRKDAKQAGKLARDVGVAIKNLEEKE
jgi:hypothetical protein